MHLDLDNVEGAAGDYSVDRQRRRPGRDRRATRRKTLRLRAKQRDRVSVPLTASGAGVGDRQRSRSAGRAASRSSAATRSTCKPATQVLTRRTVRRSRKGESLTLSNDLFADLVPGTGSVSLSVGAVDRARCGGAAQGARPLSVRLLRADHQPRAAAALCQRTGERSASRARRRRSTSASATRSTGCWRGRARTARSACGASAATTPGSTPM